MFALCSSAHQLGLWRLSSFGLSMQYAQMEAAQNHSCPCRHAMALLRAYDDIGHDVGAISHGELICAFPAAHK